MRVGVIGNYGNENNGDEAILSGIISQLTNEFSLELSDITVFSNRPENTKKRHDVNVVPLIHKRGKLSIPFTIFHSYRTMRKLDLLIIGGGGLLMDLYKRDAPLYGTLAYLGKKAKCQVIVYGVGAGPLNTRVGKFFVRLLVNCATGIAVRDPKSKQLLESLGVKKSIKVTTDPAFALKTNIQKPSIPHIKRIGITAVPYFDKGYWPTEDKVLNRLYIEGMAHNLDKLLDEHDMTLTFYATKYPEDVEAARQIRAEMKHKEKTVLIEERLTPEDIINTSIEQDLVIGTRLHSLILSMVTTTPVVGIAYHHKVKDFMAAQKLDDLVIPIEDIHMSDQLILRVINLLTQNWNTYQSLFKQLSDTLYEDASSGLRTLIEESAVFK